MPEEFRDCPMGEIPILPPELISAMHKMPRAGRRAVEQEPAEHYES
jgi:hypothetical protein